MEKIGKYLYWVLMVLMFIPFKLICGSTVISAPVALFVGLIFALIFGIPYPKFNKKLSKYLLQASVVGLGFGMNLEKSLQSGAEGMIFTVASVIIVMTAGILLGRVMRINEKTSYLISSGTAICGGSAIAAVGPVLKADQNEMAVSLGVIFILNAIALFIFPPLGHALGLTQHQFGTWAAIAIHDTSSVVGAGAAFDQMYYPGSNAACDLATLIKCTRALWIIPLAFFTMWFAAKGSRRGASGGGGTSKVSIPWFILLFVAAMIFNTYVGSETLRPVYDVLVTIAKQCLIAVLFAIGAGLSLKVIKQVGVRPLVQAVLLWVLIGVGSLAAILYLGV
ncbi:MAG: putative sulfate exporter family transporter [Muribaculaceae bacterium]|nr:putative sulfate exporter family transporter [Muribaculaceae bacterium]